MSWQVALVVAGIRLGALGGLSACGGSQGPAVDNAVPGTPAVVPDTRTPIEQRRDTACDQLAPRITACAVEDARDSLAAGKIDQAQFDRDTAPEILRKNTENFARECKGTSYSSRQIRVLEVCFREEPTCGPLFDCLGHLSDAPAKP